MSNIYIQEPPTSGKVLMKTSVGDIEIELWAKETPKACRNFVQLCLDGYYDNCLFHRVVKGFIAQGGDPTGTGEGGESIYGEPFKDEFHSRLRFTRRGLVAMANAGKDDNASQFFFTFAPAPELQNKNTIFGKVAGETIYNMIKLEEVLVDENDRPIYPQKIFKTTVITNPFDDLQPRKESRHKTESKAKKPKEKGVKNFNLLSFGEEAEEDEEETNIVAQKLSGKSKSAHDNLADPKLSSETVETLKQKEESSKLAKKSEDENSDGCATPEEVGTVKKEKEEMKDRIIDKLKKAKRKRKLSDEQVVHKEEEQQEEPQEEKEERYYLGKDRDDEKKRQLEEIKKEYRELKRGIANEKNAKIEEEKQKERDKQKKEKTSELLQEYHKTHEEFRASSEKIKKKGPSRDEFTLALLGKFQSKIRGAIEKQDDVPEAQNDEEADKLLEDDLYLAHALRPTETGPVLAKDASTKGDDWFEIYDPRNPLNKRRRGETSKKLDKKL